MKNKQQMIASCLAQINENNNVNNNESDKEEEIINSNSQQFPQTNFHEMDTEHTHHAYMCLTLK